MDWTSLLQTIALVTAAALVSYVLIAALQPWLVQYAMARPNGRSSHTHPTPQGAGIGVVASVTLVVLAAVTFGVFGAEFGTAWFKVLAAMIVLAGVGAYDDIKPLPVAPRLIAQIAAAAALVSAVPSSGSIVGVLPKWVEIPLLVVGVVWFINLTNFLDGIDWMVVVGLVPAAIFIAIFAGLDEVSASAGLAALALAGALLGFAPYNQHVARAFLGDVGSLAIGGLVAWLLLEVAAAGHLAAALLLPMYFAGDATITLVRRALRGEPVWQAHRSHYYQLAHQRGMSVPAITDRVLALNILLGLLAWVTIAWPNWWVGLIVLAIGAGLTRATMAHFDRGGA